MKKRMKTHKRQISYENRIDWLRVISDEEYAINMILPFNLIKSMRCGKNGCRKIRKLALLNGIPIMRCPNSKCFLNEKNNKTWTKPKLINFEDFDLTVGELLYLNLI